MSKQRLTKRSGNKVYINTEAIKRTDCCGKFGFRFCQYAVDCPNTTNRKCPVLRVLDKLADYEDKEEIEKSFERRKTMSREKQIKEMAELIYDSCPVPQLYDEDAVSIAQALYNEGYRKQSEGEWISVEDRLPEESCECLTVDRLGVVLQVSYSGRHRAFNASDEDDGDKWKLGGVTHWMPLPEPPKMKDGME